jgi:hypothetical protein
MKQGFLPLLILLAATLYGCAGGGSLEGGSSGTITGAGTFTLAPGESRTIRISTTYVTIRICNDVGSGGAVEGAVGGYPPVALAPGDCSANFGWYGDRITVHNTSATPATGRFQSGFG